VQLAATKSADGLWRPQAHFTGVIIHGLMEIYYMSDCDQPKDSNAQRTLLTRTIEIAAEEYHARGLACPVDWVIHALSVIKGDGSQLNKSDFRFL
jgi:hypothetical protein